MSKKPAPAADHAAVLRQAEDQWCGKDAPRTPDGKLERGHGSLWAGLTPAQKKHHAALEAAIAAETKLAAAAAAHATAAAELAAAEKTVADSQVE